MNSRGKYVLLFLSSLFFQVLLFDKIGHYVDINIYAYLLFILMLPHETNKHTALFMAFALGFIIDIFNSTLGLHTSAIVLVAFLRPYFLRIFAPQDKYYTHKILRVYVWFIKYSFVLIFIHHTYLFYIDIFSFSQFFYTLFRVVMSSLGTFLVVVFGYYLFSKE